MIGKITRLKACANAPRRKPTQPRATGFIVRSTKFKPAAPAPVLAPDYEGSLLIDGVRVTLETLDSRMCHFPFGDPKSADFHYCARKPDGNRPYCHYHLIGPGAVYDAKATQRYEKAVQARRSEVKR